MSSCQVLIDRMDVPAKADQSASQKPSHPEYPGLGLFLLELPFAPTLGRYHSIMGRELGLLVHLELSQDVRRGPSPDKRYVHESYMRPGTLPNSLRRVQSLRLSVFPYP